MKRTHGLLGMLVAGLAVVAACGADTDTSRFARLLATSTPDTKAPAATSTQAAGAGAAPAPSRSSAKLTGTWNGRPRCDDGDQVESTFRVAASGNPIHEYETKDGARSVELISVGQTIRFIPREGGVSTMVVDALSVSGETIRYTLRISHEKTSGGTLSQRRGRLAVTAAAQGARLDFGFTLEESGTLSQPGLVLPPSESTTACRGPLQRA